ncbi:hypothetical protein N0V91_010232 [Didymella pomorum]|uniref:Uncharacterized protein n=1 Tax=Didymella pomorum TaxID=749634 RepID=A0A9W9D3Q5_9PLEO|nr:hypothetical protein N0V91_010232 [Didymella pomorum]
MLCQFKTSDPAHKRPTDENSPAPASTMRTRNQSYSLTSHQDFDHAGRRDRGPQNHQGELKQMENCFKSMQGNFRKLQAEHKDLKRTYDELLSVRKYYGGAVDHIINNAIKPYARKRRLILDKDDLKSLAAVLTPMLQDALNVGTLGQQVATSQPRIQILHEDLNKMSGAKNEVEELREQVAGLQNELLAKVQDVSVVSDEHFAQDFHSIAALIKTFSRKIQLDETINLSEVLEPVALLAKISPHHWKGRKRSKIFIEAWVWSILIECVFTGAFAVFGKGCESLDQAWKQIFGSGHDHGWPQPSVASETWRSTTVKHLIDAVDESAIDPQGVEGTRLSMDEACALVSSRLRKNLGCLNSQADLASIQKIADKAFGLAMQMSKQQSRLQITCPALGAQYQGEAMSATLDADGEEMTHGNVAFVINPGLSKWGDAHGKSFDQRYEIVRCLVQLEHEYENVKTRRECDLA